MTLRTRIAVIAAVAVGVAVLMVAVGVYGLTARQLRAEVDEDLDAAAALAADVDAPPADRLARLRQLAERAGGGGLVDRLGPGGRRDRFVGPLGVGIVQLVTADGSVRPGGPLPLPVDDDIRALAADGGDPVRDTVRVEDVTLRMLSVTLGEQGALQVALPIDEAERALQALRRQLLLVGLLGSLLAAGLGAVVADGAVRPVRRLTTAAEQVRRTQDLDTRIPGEGPDEVGRLTTSFNEMLASLAAARSAQRQLVADASHELRTPLTSLRTNIEVLQLKGRLSPDQRAALLRDVTAQLEELGRLVDGVVELARGATPARAPTPVVLGDVVADVVERALIFRPHLDVDLTVDESVVMAERDRLERAVTNLVDNAVKHGGGSEVVVTVADGVLTVRDHGPGIAEEDLPHVFERFWRAPASRSRPGSGLGLSIVAQVAEAHGGRVRAANHPDGGAVVTLTLPTPPTMGDAQAGG